MSNITLEIEHQWMNEKQSHSVIKGKQFGLEKLPDLVDVAVAVVVVCLELAKLSIKYVKGIEAQQMKNFFLNIINNDERESWINVMLLWAAIQSVASLNVDCETNSARQETKIRFDYSTEAYKVADLH
ncbi:hypothetical protein GQX74_013201 [Glossina fuscipes]|nr:hypothetical protein GQX74_013201 [Glossina fuscipes]